MMAGKSSILAGLSKQWLQRTIDYEQLLYCRGICETLCQRDHVVLSMSIFHYVFL
eukprot:403338603